jgi:predicted nucleotidyltransferase
VDATTETSFERQFVEEPQLLGVLHDVMDALEQAHVRYLGMGGIASAALGRARWTHDIDLFVRPEDTRRALAALADRGFATKEPGNMRWLCKAMRDGVLVDLIYRSDGDITMDDQMLARSVTRTFKGLDVRFLSPEDLVVMKALATKEDTAHYWHDALAVIASNDLDWDYVLHRARHGARRVLGLLLFAQSVDLLVSDRAIRELFDRIYDPDR